MRPFPSLASVSSSGPWRDAMSMSAYSRPTGGQLPWAQLTVGCCPCALQRCLVPSPAPLGKPGCSLLSPGDTWPSLAQLGPLCPSPIWGVMAFLPICPLKGANRAHRHPCVYEENDPATLLCAVWCRSCPCRPSGFAERPAVPGQRMAACRAGVFRQEGRTGALDE